ncbi:hypothetical protein [Mycobacteroides abscessus]|uniref:hypothetical protein n=1 Tax=Mycobacteroides abscessus TaxID=36809 RepID=UPI0013F5A5C9|nr:hypothetical protein [Mycobacteroides abscessus]
MGVVVAVLAVRVVVGATDYFPAAGEVSALPHARELNIGHLIDIDDLFAGRAAVPRAATEAEHGVSATHTVVP